ncbi:MAG: endonuclease III [Candidatus Tectomicrobia bacterium]|nr:endonuclease III [Candidatus Tectomicrobia bacterium]
MRKKPEVRFRKANPKRVGAAGAPPPEGGAGEPDGRRIGRVLGLLEKAYPDAECALHHRNPLQLLVATILSAQCTDARVNLVTPALFRAFPDARAFAEADPGEVERLIRSCGYFRQKAKSIHACCRALAEEHGGEVPRTREELTRLAGVGRKTANVILNEAFGVPAVAVDTHVLRTSNRLGWVRTQDPLKVELELLEMTPRRWWGRVTLLLIHHGRRCCTARKPRCGACSVLAACPYGRKETAPSSA